ncbi:MAG: mu-protocadherin- cell-suface protein, partial [Planctomycetia bacterium]|nr:mu-protocadherin- cell-suface protein [Planctomycetia bacterium]
AQAQQLAASGAAQLEQTPAAGTEEQWMPLGMFAVSTSKEDESPLFILQMAVNKKGVINGTLYNLATKSTKPILGAVDPKTQRACWYVGDKPETVAETGIYNLTKDETSVLVHYGQDKTEEYMLVRLPPPAESKTKAASVGLPALSRS